MFQLKPCMKSTFLLLLSLSALYSCKKNENPSPDNSIAPTITKVSDVYGLYGKSIAIEGTNFSSVKEENIVEFNGHKAIITSVYGGNLLSATVPLDCGTGAITVTVNKKTATGPVFNYIGGEVTTWAGNGNFEIKNDSRINAGFASPLHIAKDKAGNMYVTEASYAIRKIAADGQVSILAGNVDSFGYEDGTASQARFQTPKGIVCDASGNVYVADQHAVRKITPGGIVSTYAGSMFEAGYIDGNLNNARFGSVSDIAIDKNGNLYVCDVPNLRIRKIAVDGTVSTFAGNGESGYADGPALSAKFYTLEHLCADEDGNVYVADSWSERIRKITPAGIVSTIAGSGDNSYRDAQGVLADFSDPSMVAADKMGNVYVTDNHGLVRKIYPDGNVVTIAGTPEQRGFVNGALYETKFYNPSDIEIDDDGNIYVADSHNNVIRRIVFQ